MKNGMQELGAGLLEYAVLVALIALVCLGGVTATGAKANKTLCETNNKFDRATIVKPFYRWDPDTNICIKIKHMSP